MTVREIREQEKQKIMERMVEKENLKNVEEQIKWLEEWQWSLDMIDRWDREIAEQYSILTELIKELKGAE